MAIKDQWSDIIGDRKVVELLAEYNERKTKDAIVAKDADNLDQIFLQKEYLSDGPADFKRWHDYAVRGLKTSSAKTIAKLVSKTNPLKWVYDLEKEHRKGKKNHINKGRLN
jgi:5'-deoxynucleotidase YfbR-like HD superfamily hydrolase